MNTEKKEIMEILIKNLPGKVVLTDDSHAELINESVERLINAGFSPEKIEFYEDKLIKEDKHAHIFPLLVLKVAKSKLLADNYKKPLFVSVVFAVYKEHNRILSSKEHPFGENFLLKKVDQLDRLFGNRTNIRWELIVVDDGCPEGSGKIAEEIARKNKLTDKVRVLFLQEAIDKKLPPVKNLKTASDSQKGGSIIYGMWDALQRGDNENRVIIYTDADLSTHLGQSMLLIEPLVNKEKFVAIGSRREPKSVVIKQSARNNRGKLFIYLWKKMIPNLKGIFDTQCGFKAFRAETLKEILSDLLETKFAFDIELLIKAEQYKAGSIAKVPVAWIDSVEASTTTDLQPYLPMLKSIVKMNRKYFPDYHDADDIADFIEKLSEEEFQKLLENIPEEIISRDVLDFETYNGVGADQLKARIQ